MSTYVEAGLLVRELVRQGEGRPVLGHPSHYSSGFLVQGGEQINNWVIPTIFDTASTDADALDYMAMMAEADEEPPTAPEAANHYDIILMLAQVMRAAGIDGGTPPEQARLAIRDGLLDLAGFDGVAGETSFAGQHDAAKEVYVKVVVEGEVRPLE
jgi:ABC-type branched-subunit amino acid transport system substrate-binding protein